LEPGWSLIIVIFIDINIRITNIAATNLE
jgi:hypothetical protein